jgi:transposase InsO family protein
MGAYVLVRDRVGHEDTTSEPADYSTHLHVPNVRNMDIEYTIIDLYAVRPESHETQEKRVKPFVHQVKLHGLEKGVIEVWGLFDNGAMVDAMSTTAYMQIKHRLPPLGKSIRRLRMANGSIVNPLGCWEGTVELGGTTVKGSFEVFDSDGSWDFLFGKRLLTAFKAVHDYDTDEVFLPARQCTLQNQYDMAHQTTQTPNNEERELEKGDNAQSPVRGVLPKVHPRVLRVVDTPTSVGTQQCSDAQLQEQVPRPGATQVEEQVNITGDRTKSPLRGVPNAALNGDEQAINEIMNPSTIAEKVAGDASPEQETNENEEAQMAITEEPTVQEQNTAREEPEHQKKQAKAKASRVRKSWKGTSQRRYCRWKVRNTNAVRAKRGRSKGGTVEPPVREVTNHDPHVDIAPADIFVEELEESITTPVCVISSEANDIDADQAAEIPTEDLAEDTANIFTRTSDPFKPARVEEVLRQITIGDDLTDQESAQVRALIEEFADVFALSVSEVTQVEGAVHRLNIDPNTKFSTKVHQKPLTPPQRRYLHEKLQAMLDADVIEPCEPGQVKCVSPTTLAQKTHEGTGLTLDELQHRVNDECVRSGLEPHFALPPRPEPVVDDRGDKKDEPKWRICQNFSQINKVTQVAPMPQGDIRSKQQRLSGHRWVSTFDFAAGFYAVLVDPESRPYTAFYVEGWGYFWYKRMPFGLTGAPSTFAHMTGQHLYDLLVAEVLELFVDDGGTAADVFSEMMDKLRRIFTRVRERGLSLSPSKSKFFMTTAEFAGATVGPNGVQPDLSKLTAIVNWKAPTNALNLSSFLGLTGWFRDLIKDYAKIEQPLRDLIREVDLPEKYSKTVYRRIMANHSFEGRWTTRHTEAFLKLKAIMTSEPVLRGPKWDGTPFVVTSDGSKDAFGAVLAQKSATVLTSGRTVTKLHPIAFASKRTSKTEEKYKPFLLEFAGLKFALDKFSDIIWGFPVEVETDCQALRDHLMNDKLSATHARWRDGILSHQIVDVRHVPGRINVVADGLSRAAEGTPREEGDGSEWTVSEDWEATTGLTHDLFHVADAGSEEMTALRERFRNVPMLLEVVDALLELDQGTSLRKRKRARHRASEYMIDEGKLWRVAGGHRTRARARVECVSPEEATELAKEEHTKNGHWQRDSVKKALLDRIWSPGLDSSIIAGIKDCAHCKNFGGTHLHALLDPITRRHPFELLVGDYLSLPKGFGGYHTVGLYLDTYSQHVWGFKIKVTSSGKTTQDALAKVFHEFTPAEVFMTDGGPHFNNQAVRDLCAEWGTETHVVSAYSPWVNGLVEGANKILLHILKRLCSPNLGEDDYNAMEWENIPASWPKYFDEAIRIMNWRLLPSLKFSPKELLLGLVVNTKPTNVDLSTLPIMEQDVAAQMAYVAQQRLDGYAEAVTHAMRRKSAFDRKVLGRTPGEVTFSIGQLVQIYRSDLDDTFKTERKLLPKWSPPHRVASKILNSYTLETLTGSPINGRFSARRLRGFSPREGTELAEVQKEVETKCREQEKEREKEDAKKIEEERRLDRVEKEEWKEMEQQAAEATAERTETNDDDEEAEEDEVSVDEENMIEETETDEEEE